jgi:formiminotetrahydrofolate cyclodeaminase
VTADELRRAPLQQLLEAIAAKTPTPGGGTVAPIIAALAAALGRMVLSFSLGKKSLAAHESANAAAMTHLQRAIDSLLNLATSDAAAYARLNELQKLDKADPKRTSAWPTAVAAAIDAPSRVLDESLAILDLLDSLTTTTNRMLASDLAIAAVLAEAAARSAAWNVRINLPLVNDAAPRAAIETDVTHKLDKAISLARKIENACRADS